MSVLPKAVSKSAVDVINITTNSKIIIPKGKEVCDMCKGIKGLVDDGIAKGMVDG